MFIVEEDHHNRGMFGYHTVLSELLRLVWLIKRSGVNMTVTWSKCGCGQMRNRKKKTCCDPKKRSINLGMM